MSIKELTTYLKLKCESNDGNVFFLKNNMIYIFPETGEVYNICKKYMKGYTTPYDDCIRDLNDL